MECLPPSLAGRQYYFPTDRGMEKRIAERMEEIRRRREKPEGVRAAFRLRRYRTLTSISRSSSPTVRR